MIFGPRAPRKAWKLYCTLYISVINRKLESDFLYTFSFIFQLFCDTEVDRCREWNNNRQEKEEQAYDRNM
jgi:hypothetical protein